MPASGIKASVSDLGIDQIDLVSSSCGGASHAPPACSGVRCLTKTEIEEPFEKIYENVEDVVKKILNLENASARYPINFMRLCQSC